MSTEFYGLLPGGTLPPSAVNSPLIADGIHLDTMIVPGRWVRLALPTLASDGYPTDNFVGHLEIMGTGSGSYTLQRATALRAIDPDPPVVYERVRTTTLGVQAWSAWRQIPRTAPDLSGLRPVRLATTADDVNTLPTGDYQVTTGAIATAIGLPEAAHGVVHVDRWGSGLGFATFETRSQPVKTWSRTWDSNGTPGSRGWERTTIDSALIRQVRLATTADTLDALTTGDYQVAFADVATALGLPVVLHGTLVVDRWGTNQAGVATYTTRSDPAQVWSYSWDTTGAGQTWQQIAPAPVSDTYGPDYAIRHEHLRTRHEALLGGPIDVGTATPVCFTWDDYPADMRDKGIVDLAEQYEIPLTYAICSRTMTPERAEHLGGIGITWPEVDQWVADGWVQLANHGADHWNTISTPAGLYDEIVTGLEELRALSPSGPIDTWAMSTNLWPDFESGPDADAWATYAGQLILGHHAFATGKASALPDRSMPMTGVPIQGQDRAWVETVNQTEAQRKAIVSDLYGTNRGIIIGAHALHVGGTDRWTIAEVEEYFAWLQAEQTAGRIKLMFLSEWAWAKSAN